MIARNPATLRPGFAPGERPLADTLWFTPGRGDHARAFLIVGENTEAFRADLRKTADAGLFRNKQIMLATCFDVSEMPALREMLLNSGALLVWTPERKITPEAAGKLNAYVQQVAETPATAGSGTIEDTIPAALKLWHAEDPGDSDLGSLMDASQWVRLEPPMASPRTAAKTSWKDRREPSPTPIRTSLRLTGRGNRVPA
jgi:hypothetical protein